MPAMLHVIFGPIGAGTTTYAHALARREGAVAFVLDRGDGGLGRLAGSSGTSLAGWDEPLADRLQDSWKRAGLSPSEADLFLPAANHSFLDRLESAALRKSGAAPKKNLAVKPQTGEGFAYTSFLQVAAGLLLTEPGETALAQALHVDGAASAVALERVAR